jgi:hypothetical protein
VALKNQCAQRQGLQRNFRQRALTVQDGRAAVVWEERAFCTMERATTTTLMQRLYGCGKKFEERICSQPCRLTKETSGPCTMQKACALLYDGEGNKACALLYDGEGNNNHTDARLYGCGKKFEERICAP